MLEVPASPTFGGRRGRQPWTRLGRGFTTFAILCTLHGWYAVSGEHLAETPQNPSALFAHSEHRCGHTPTPLPSQHVGLRPGGLAVADSDRDQLLGPIAASTHDDHAHRRGGTGQLSTREFGDRPPAISKGRQ